MKTHLRKRPLSYFVLVVMLAVGGRAQSRLVFVSEDQTWPVAGMVSGVLAREEAGKFFPFAGAGGFSLQAGDEVEFLQGEMEVDYLVALEPSADATGADRLTVKQWTKIRAWEAMEGLHLVRAWVDDGDMVQVSAIRLPRFERMGYTVVRHTFNLPKERANGRVWCGLFRDAKPVRLIKGKPESVVQLQLLSALERDARAEVAAAVRAGARWVDLSEAHAEDLALHGQLEALQQWTTEKRSWQKKNGPDLLWNAVRASRSEVAQWLLDSGVNPAQPNRVDGDLLNMAVETRKTGLVESLLAANQGAWSQRAFKSSPLVTAAKFGDRAMVNQLLQAGLKWPRETDELARGFYYALDKRSADGISALLSSGMFDPRDVRRDEFIAGVLRYGAIVGDPDLLKLLVAPGVPWDRLAKLDRHPLAHAVDRGHLAAMDVLIDSGANPHELVWQDKWDLVSSALVEGQMDALRRLQELGVKPTTLAANLDWIWRVLMRKHDLEAGAWLAGAGVGIGGRGKEAAELMIQALAENYAPLLEAARSDGWTSASELGDGWTVGGFAAWTGATELATSVGLAGAAARVDGPGPLVSAKGLEVHDRIAPAYPPSAVDWEEAGETTIQVLIDAEGRVGYARIAEANAPEFGREARRALLKWIFSPLPKGESGWRRVTVPVGFQPLMDTDQVVRSDKLDRVPVVVSMPPVQTRPEGAHDEQGLALVDMLIDAEGRVPQARVRMITDEAWRAKVESAVRRWQFQPGLKDDKPAMTAMTFNILYPLRGMIPDEGLLVHGAAKPGVNETLAVLQSGRSPYLTEESVPNGAIALIEVTVKTNGRVDDVQVLASNPADVTEKFVKMARGWKFRPATRDGKPIEQRILMPVTFYPWTY